MPRRPYLVGQFGKLNAGKLTVSTPYTLDEAQMPIVRRDGGNVEVEKLRCRPGYIFSLEPFKGLIKRSEHRPVRPYLRVFRKGAVIVFLEPKPMKQIRKLLELHMGNARLARVIL